MGLSPKFWAGKRVFLTGHTGFKGSWLSLWLNSMGADLTGFALQPSSTPNLFELANIENDMTSIIGDIRDFDQIKKAINLARPEIVIHMAAQPLVRYSYQNPLETYATNVMGTLHLFESLRETIGLKVILNVTSDKCYENKEQGKAFKEEDPIGGYDPYSSSKGCAELVTSSYRSSFFNINEYNITHNVAMASARAGNVIGGGDWSKDRLIPDFVRALDKTEALNIRNPKAVRPWQHVLEPLAGYLALSERLYSDGIRFAEAWNFGPDESDAKTVMCVAKLFAQYWGGSE